VNDGTRNIRSPLKKAVHPSTKLRTNGGKFEFIGEFPFVLRHSKHEILFFSNLILGETIEARQADSITRGSAGDT
jgi:hypothetical protein